MIFFACDLLCSKIIIVLCLCCVDVGSDVTLANNLIRPLAIASTPLVPVFFTLRVDRVSQEINETFNITLTLNPNTAEPADFFPTITVCIIDQDGEFPNRQMMHY